MAPAQRRRRSVPPSLRKFETALKAIMGLFFFSNYYEIFE